MLAGFSDSVYLGELPSSGYRCRSRPVVELERDFGEYARGRAGRHGARDQRPQRRAGSVTAEPLAHRSIGTELHQVALGGDPLHRQMVAVVGAASTGPCARGLAASRSTAIRRP